MNSSVSVEKIITILQCTDLDKSTLPLVIYECELTRTSERLLAVARPVGRVKYFFKGIIYKCEIDQNQQENLNKEQHICYN